MDNTTSLEQVFQYIASDDTEKQFYSNIIIKIKEISSELSESLDSPLMAEELFTRMKQCFKDLDSLVMLRKLYISGIIADPHSAKEVTTVTLDQVI